MSQLSFEQRVGMSVRRLQFENDVMRALVAPDVPVVDVEAVKSQAEILKTGTESVTERDAQSAEVLLRSIANLERLDAPIPASERDERHRAAIESATEHFSRDDLK